MASSSVAIKVEYGETLRCFSASYNDKKLSLDYVMLRDKICSLFSFGSDVEFTLTYVDGNGDVAALASDNDLLDVVQQSLSPLRIMVKLNNGTFEQMRQLHILRYQQNLSNQTLNPQLTWSTTTSSDPRVAELAEKLKLTNLNQIPNLDGLQGVNFESLTLKDSKDELNSQFLYDVSVPDGTVMAPYARFTKIWRMQNNGAIKWPHGSQLQWTGGHQLGDLRSVDIEIPEDGLPMDKDLDITVDFTAPGLSGKYVSFWTMVSPFGQKFGQQVSVRIQVDASLYDPLMDSEKSFIDLTELIDSEDTSIDSKRKYQEINYPIIDDVGSTMGTLSSPATREELESDADSVRARPKISSRLYSTVGVHSGSVERISYPEVDCSKKPTIMGCAEPSTSTVGVSHDDLDDMRFEQLDWNYDLQKLFDDLCGVSEWDPMLIDSPKVVF